MAGVNNNLRRLFTLLFLLLLPSLARAQTCTAHLYSDSSFTTLLGYWQDVPCNGAPLCNYTGTSKREVQNAVDASTTDNAIKVAGYCEHGVNITEAATRIVLDGQGSARLVARSSDNSTISINGGAGITIRDFLSITNGSSTGILVNRGASAVIVNNTIENNGHGIRVEDGGTARIGSTFGGNPVASPNVIRANTLNGIFVNRGSSARIVSNTISGNGAAGVSVTKVSQADIADNTIDNNTGGGIVVSENSGVDFGNDTGIRITDLPNDTGTNNPGFGISCTINSYADGRLGTLNGTSGQKSFDATCVDSLIP